MPPSNLTSINFPANPTVGQSYTYSNQTYQWSGTEWVVSYDSNSIPIGAVTLSGNQTIGGVKTFSSTPSIPFTAAGAGATQRTTLDKLRDVVSVKDFGAVGDGVADDTAAIQAAINSVALSSNTLWFPTGTYLISTSLSVQQEGMLLLGAGRDYVGQATGTILKTTAAINLFSFTPASRRTTVQNMVLDGNNVGLCGGHVAVSCPKVQFSNCTVKRFVSAGLIINSFSTVISECDVIENLGHGIHYKDSSANDSRVFGGSVSSNAQHGIFVDTSTGYPDGIYIDGVNMENNCTSGSAASPYAHVMIGDGTVGVYISNMYHESDITQAGFANQLFYKIGGGSQSVFLGNIKTNCSSGAEFLFHIYAGASAYPVVITNCWAGGVGTAIINNAVGASGSLITNNVVKQTATGFQSSLVDYAGSPTTAGQSLTTLPARLVAKVGRTSSAQTISSTSPTTIQFNHVVFDPASMFDSGAYGLKVREEGYYQVNARIAVLNFTANEIAKFEVSIAGSTVDFTRFQLITGTSVTAEINTIAKCNSGDLITIKASKTTNNFDIVGDFTYSNLSITKIAQDD